MSFSMIGVWECEAGYDESRDWGAHTVTNNATHAINDELPLRQVAVIANLFEKVTHYLDQGTNARSDPIETNHAQTL